MMCNFKDLKGEGMEKIRVNDTEDLIMEHIMLDESDQLLVVGYYETIISAINFLIKEYDVNFTGGEIIDPDYDGYEDSYYLEFYDDEFSVGKTYNEKLDEYLMFDIDTVFVEEDFVDDFLRTNKPDHLVVFGFNDIAGDDYDFMNDDGCVCIDEDKKGFSLCIHDDYGHTKFRYRGCKELSHDDIQEILYCQFA